MAVISTSDDIMGNAQSDNGDAQARADIPMPSTEPRDESPATTPGTEDFEMIESGEKAYETKAPLLLKDSHPASPTEVVEISESAPLANGFTSSAVIPNGTASSAASQAIPTNVLNGRPSIGTFQAGMNVIAAISSNPTGARTVPPTTHPHNATYKKPELTAGEKQQLEQLLTALKDVNPRVAQECLRAQWQKFLFDAVDPRDDSLIQWLLRALLKNAPTTAIQKVYKHQKSAAKLFANPQDVLNHVPDELIEDMMQKQIQSMDSRKLIAMLGRAGRLGFTAEDDVDDDEVVMPYIPGALHPTEIQAGNSLSSKHGTFNQPNQNIARGPAKPSIVQVPPNQNGARVAPSQNKMQPLTSLNNASGLLDNVQRSGGFPHNSTQGSFLSNGSQGPYPPIGLPSALNQSGARLAQSQISMQALSHPNEPSFQEDSQSASKHNSPYQPQPTKFHQGQLPPTQPALRPAPPRPYQSQYAPITPAVSIQHVPPHLQTPHEREQAASTIRDPVPAGTFVCNICLFSFPNRSGYNYHTFKRLCSKAPSESIRAQCHKCAQSFTTTQGLTYHLLKDVCQGGDPLNPSAAEKAMQQGLAALKAARQQHANATHAGTYPTFSPVPAHVPIPPPVPASHSAASSVGPTPPPGPTHTSIKPPHYVSAPRKSSGDPRTVADADDEGNDSDIRKPVDTLDPAQKAEMDLELDAAVHLYNQKLNDIPTDKSPEERERLQISAKNGLASKKSSIRKRYGVSLRLRDKDKAASGIAIKKTRKSRAAAEDTRAEPVMNTIVRRDVSASGLSGFSPINGSGSVLHSVYTPTQLGTAGSSSSLYMNDRANRNSSGTDVEGDSAKSGKDRKRIPIEAAQDKWEALQPKKKQRTAAPSATTVEDEDTINLNTGETMNLDGDDTSELSELDDDDSLME